MSLGKASVLLQKWTPGPAYPTRRAFVCEAHQRGEGQAGHLAVAAVGHWSLFWGRRGCSQQRGS